MNNIKDLFPATKQVSMDLGDDPNIFFMAQLSFGIPEFVASCIPPIQDYIAV